MRIRLLALAIMLAGCAQPPVPTNSPVPEPTPISEEMAVSIARAQPSPKLVPGEDVLDARRMTFGELTMTSAAPSIEPSRCVWHVRLGYGPGSQMGHGSTAIIDCLTGEVLWYYEWVS